MNCPYCGQMVVAYKQISTNGAKTVILRCAECKKIPDPKRMFYSNKDYPNFEELPLLNDYSLSSEPCAYVGCTNIGTEYHHLSPRHLFEDAEYWPTCFLCKPHHDLWHRKTRTGAFYDGHKRT